MPSTRLGFAGTPAFAATILAALIEAGRVPVAVWTQPDRRAGRGRKLAPSPVKAVSLEHGIPVHQPRSLRDSTDPAGQSAIANAQLDLLIVVAYGLILPPAVLEAPAAGCLNVHASLLPRWRGAAPIQAALLAGDAETGVTIMQMEAGLDTGPMLLKRTLAVTPGTNAEALTDALATLGASALLAALDNLANGTLRAEPQREVEATYAGRIQKSDARLNFDFSAQSLVRMVRAYYGWPVAHTSLGAETLRVWTAEALADSASAAPGTVVGSGRTGIDIATSDGVLRIKELQRPGGKRVTAEQFLAARPLAVGQRLG
ncbi:MAG: methionyl-tRNA formyltransferase [Pseudomonadota bacterium]